MMSCTSCVSFFFEWWFLKWGVTSAGSRTCTFLLELIYAAREGIAHRILDNFFDLEFFKLPG